LCRLIASPVRQRFGHLAICRIRQLYKYSTVAASK
jgi:hypothetical protein